MILLDNIVFEIQKAGGVSLVWRSIIDACLKDNHLDYRFLDSGEGSTNIFYPEAIPKNLCIKDHGKLSIRRYQNIDKSTPATVFHSSYFRTHKGKHVKNIVTVHDFVYEKFDKGLRKHVHLFQKKKALKNADVVICVSENTKQDLLSYHPWIKHKDIRVIHNGVGDNFHPITSLPNEIKEAPYLLYVGGRFAHKNFALALELLQTPNAQKLGLRLKIAGGGAISPNEKALIKSLGVEVLVSHTGHISNEELNLLYNQAYALIYPSLYEGFGIPPLEAMSAGCPVICSNVSSIPEVVGEAGLLFDPYNLESANERIKQLEDVEYRKKIISNGLLHAEKFSWQKTGEKTVALYKELL